jgi:two-component sensor histidine kinase
MIEGYMAMFDGKQVNKPGSCDELELRFSEHEDELKLLQKLNEMANLGRPLRDILQKITSEVSRIFGYGACDIYILDADARELVLNSISIDSKALALAESLTGLSAQGLRVPLFEGSVFNEVIINKKPCMSSDMVKVFEDFTPSKTLRKIAPKVASVFGFKSVIRAPLIALDEVIGIIGVARKDNITGEDSKVLLRFASQAALIIRKLKAEANLQLACNELEEKVIHRTHDLRETVTGLQAEVSKRVKAEDRLKKALRDKDMMIKEVHHRVKNNLVIIQSLLKLQSRQAAEGLPREHLMEAENRVNSMSMIHDYLSRSEDKRSIEAPQYIQGLVNILFHNYSLSGARIRLDMDIQNVSLDVDTMIPVGLIINELVSNALKHAFTDTGAGTICVKLHAVDSDGYELLVKDDGIGMRKDYSLQSAKSLGMQIVSSFVSQLNARMEVAANNGTEFLITFRGNNLDL